MRYVGSLTLPKAMSEPTSVEQLVGQLYRRQAGQLVATLTRIFGADHIDTAENVVQETFLKAYEVWPYRGVPPNPMGWLTTVAKNHAVDVVRREQRFADKKGDILAWSVAASPAAEPSSILAQMADIDDQLCLMLMCCHPSLSPQAQLCLTLRTVGGFSVREIARGFLSKEEAIRKTISRAKKQLRDQQIHFTFPNTDELPERITAVLQVLYLIFNEGYSASGGDELIRPDLCDQAIWLTSLFLHESFDHFPKLPTINALLALMLLQSSRIPARIGAEGQIIRLSQQDRSRWDRERIRLGLYYLRASLAGDEVSSYHLQAQIAAFHAGAGQYETADWGQIVACYEQLLRLEPSPIVALNRAVALSMRDGPAAGLQALGPLAEEPRLRNYHWLAAAFADMHLRLDQLPEALCYYQQAADLAPTRAEQAHFQQRLAKLSP
ncbi:MAG: sigma-70 family RNA polymerase sigma factor [Chloroflexota bacterium]